MTDPDLAIDMRRRQIEGERLIQQGRLKISQGKAMLAEVRLSRINNDLTNLDPTGQLPRPVPSDTL